MSTRETQELEAAGQKLTLETLKKSLEANDGDASGKKDEILQRIGNRVLEIGLEGFLDGLEKQRLREVFDSVKFKEAGKRRKESPKAKLFRHVLDVGLEYFLQDCSQELLNHFCAVLLLEQSTNDSMVSQIADEIMLTGTKRFLHNLSVSLLKKWCQQLGLKPSVAKKQLVEQLMVHVFELEPLEDEEQEEEDEIDEDGEKGRKGAEGERQGKLGDELEDKGNGKVAVAVESIGSADKIDQQQGSGKREKYVAPPISTIKKGMTKEQLHNTFNATDLKEYCKQHNMTSSGKKPVLIKRILKYLETGEIEVPKARRGGGKRKRPSDKPASQAKRAKAGDNGEDEEGEGDVDVEDNEEADAQRAPLDHDENPLEKHEMDIVKKEEDEKEKEETVDGHQSVTIQESVKPVKPEQSQETPVPMEEVHANGGDADALSAGG